MPADIGQGGGRHLGIVDADQLRRACASGQKGQDSRSRQQQREQAEGHGIAPGSKGESVTLGGR
jgi:hypothetical protein